LIWQNSAEFGRDDDWPVPAFQCNPDDIGILYMYVVRFTIILLAPRFMNDMDTGRTKTYLYGYVIGILLLLKFVVTGARDDISNLPLPEFQVLEADKNVLEKALQFAERGRRRVEFEGANVGLLQDTKRYVDEATFLVPGKIAVNHVFNYRRNDLHDARRHVYIDQ